MIFIIHVIDFELIFVIFNTVVLHIPELSIEKCKDLFKIYPLHHVFNDLLL